MKKVECVFLDTNILLDVLWKRNIASIRLLEQLRIRKIPIYISYLSVLELVDKEQENVFLHKLLAKHLSLNEIFRKKKEKRLTLFERKEAVDKVFEILKEYEINLVIPEGEYVWKKAIIIMQDINAEANDAFHIASAYQADCMVFVTRDERLGKQISKLEDITWYKPEDLLKILEKN